MQDFFAGISFLTHYGSTYLTHPHTVSPTGTYNRIVTLKDSFSKTLG